MGRFRASPAATSTAACRNISADPSGRAWAISPTPRPRCSASDVKLNTGIRPRTHASRANIGATKNDAGNTNMRVPSHVRTAAEVLVDQLIANGVRHVFCVPGESYLAV